MALWGSGVRIPSAPPSKQRRRFFNSPAFLSLFGTFLQTEADTSSSGSNPSQYGSIQFSDVSGFDLDGAKALAVTCRYVKTHARKINGVECNQVDVAWIGGS